MTLEETIRQIVRDEIAKGPHKKTLRELRGAAGFSQQQLSEISGVRCKTIGSVEGGKRIPRRSTLAKLASALGVSVEEIG